MNPGVDPGEIRTTSDVTCLACGCLCDDLSVTVVAGRVTEARSACELGHRWFLEHGDDADVSDALVRGRVVESAEAIDQAAWILSASQAPVIWGLTRTTNEAVRAALALADAIGARVVLDRNVLEMGRVASFQEQGRVTATLGEVKNRADLVLYWGVDPLTTHPRHWERYSVGPNGRFIPEGRAGRTVIVVDRQKTATAEKADVFVRLPPELQVETLIALRMILHERRIDSRTAGFVAEWLPALENLAQRLKKARYGALFFQPTSETRQSSELAWQAAARLVRGLNELTRFVILGMGSPGNLAGAESALTWQSGFLQGVDYRLGYPTPIDDRMTLDDVLRSAEADAIVLVGDAAPSTLSAEANANLGFLPVIAIGPGSTKWAGPNATVALATSKSGYDAPGTVVRNDGVALPLRPVRASRFPGDSEILQDITRAVIDRRAGSS